jgi:hypothetical protein
MVATTTPLSIAMVGTELILADYYAGSVFSVPKVGGPLKVLATQQRPIFPLGTGGTCAG